MTAAIPETAGDIDLDAVFTSEQVVVLHVDGSDYAVPISSVHEIVRVPEITPMPEADGDVEGLINLRGQVLPVVNLGSRLGFPLTERTSDTRIIVVEGPDGAAGLLVDAVTQVLKLPAGSVAPPNPVAVALKRPAVCGVARVGERLILLLDLFTTLNVL
jgi:purine-binding chemotaxis protein CheW